MKKRISLVLVLILALCVTIGFKETPAISDIVKNDIKEDVVEKTELSIADEEETDIPETKAHTFSTETISNENILGEDKVDKVITDSLSTDDKVVKSEISKYSNTKVDFRYNKQEIIKGKSFDITFSEIDHLSSYKGVIYKNDLGDEFVYNTDNGKLRYAIMESLIVKKTAESIDFETAKRIAAEYVAENCDISKYTMNQHKEIESGYYFCYTRYIGGYPSNDRYSIQIGYDGVIVYISDFTDTFIGKKLNYSKEFIGSKIKEYSGEMEIDWDSITICISDGRVAASYTVPEAHAIAITPLE